MRNSPNTSQQNETNINAESTATIRDLRVLYRNAHLSKSRHYSAAKRSRRLNNVLSYLVVLINLALGSVFFLRCSQQKSPTWQSGQARSLLLSRRCVQGHSTLSISVGNLRVTEALPIGTYPSEGSVNSYSADTMTN